MPGPGFAGRADCKCHLPEQAPQNRTKEENCAHLRDHNILLADEKFNSDFKTVQTEWNMMTPYNNRFVFPIKKGPLIFAMQDIIMRKQAFRQLERSAFYADHPQPRQRLSKWREDFKGARAADTMAKEKSLVATRADQEQREMILLMDSRRLFVRDPE